MRSYLVPFYLTVAAETPEAAVRQAVVATADVPGCVVANEPDLREEDGGLRIITVSLHEYLAVAQFRVAYEWSQMRRDLRGRRPEAD